jgi:hypothetical protein
VKTTAQATITPAEYGWYLSPAYPQTVTVPLPAGVSGAQIVETFVKHASSDVYDPWMAQDGDSIDVMVVGGMIDIEVTEGHSLVPGGSVDPYYAVGGQCITVDTPAGPEKLTTGATYTFAYLLQEKLGSGS